jgi:uncharacterized protein YciI
MKYYALFYDVVENFAERRMPYREPHLALIKAAQQRGDIVMAGALGEPPEQAMIIFRVADVVTVENFARVDPYVLNNVAAKWTVKPWNVVVGGAQ